MDNTNIIKPVEDNQGKYLSYKSNLARYNKAKSEGFYLECLWILYSMLEDRTSAFLYHIGFTNKKNTVTGSKKIKPQIRQILNIPDDKINYNFGNLSGKLSRIIQVINWNSENDDSMSKYKETLNNTMQGLAKNKDLEIALLYLNNEWREKRNQLTHALFKKEPNDAVAELIPLIENGYNAIRQLDNAIRIIKKKDIRKKFNIQ